MNKDVPKWAVSATVQFPAQLISLPTVTIHMKFPRDTDQMEELLAAWYEPRTGNSRFTFNELLDSDPSYPSWKRLRQVTIDLRNVLFIETFYYGETNAEPNQTSP